MALETKEELQALQALLDTSMAKAGAHLRRIADQTPPARAEALVALLPAMQTIDLATVSSKGEPRVAPVDGHFLKGRWYFGSAPDSMRARHLAARPAASAAHTRGEGLCVIVHGNVEQVSLRDPASAWFLERLRSVYPGFDEWGFHDNPYWTLHPTHMYARITAEEAASTGV
jgi:hypothetical protein